MRPRSAAACSGKSATASACTAIITTPDSLSSGIDSYREANVGASWTIMRPLSIQAGYRYLNLAGKDGNRDNTIADGPYIGASASF